MKEGDVLIAREDPRQADVLPLITALDAYHVAIYPPESNHFLDVESLAAADVHFLVARAGERPLGIGALWVKVGDYGEVKRMFVDPAMRGHGLGRHLLRTIESVARNEALPCLRLETGTLNREALGLYRAVGFAERGPFGDYAAHPMCVFMEKRI